MDKIKLGQMEEKMSSTNVVVIGTGENIPKFGGQVETKASVEFKNQDGAPIRRQFGLCTLSCCCPH